MKPRRYRIGACAPIRIRPIDGKRLGRLAFSLKKTKTETLALALDALEMLRRPDQPEDSRKGTP